jgi:intergrase/recombinase
MSNEDFEDFCVEEMMKEESEQKSGLEKQAVRIGLIDHAEKEAKTKYLSNRTPENKALWEKVLDRQYIPLEDVKELEAENKQLKDEQEALRNTRDKWYDFYIEKTKQIAKANEILDVLITYCEKGHLIDERGLKSVRSSVAKQSYSGPEYTVSTDGKGNYSAIEKELTK